MIFKIFTDFRFKYIPIEKRIAILDSLSRLKFVPEYPEKGAIQFFGNDVVVILDSMAISPEARKMSYQEEPMVFEY